jgi:uncharacterized protein YjiS (DUF1127 family)
MATITTNAGSTVGGTSGAKRPSILSRIADFFNEVGDLRSRADRVEALMRLSDAQLAEKGLTRETIVTHVFRDKMYL